MWCIFAIPGRYASFWRGGGAPSHGPVPPSSLRSSNALPPPPPPSSDSLPTAGVRLFGPGNRSRPPLILRISAVSFAKKSECRCPATHRRPAPSACRRCAVQLMWEQARSRADLSTLAKLCYYHRRVQITHRLSRPDPCPPEGWWALLWWNVFWTAVTAAVLTAAGLGLWWWLEGKAVGVTLVRFASFLALY